MDSGPFERIRHELEIIYDDYEGEFRRSGKPGDLFAREDEVLGLMQSGASSNRSSEPNKDPPNQFR